MISTFGISEYIICEYEFEKIKRIVRDATKTIVVYIPKIL